MNATTKTEAREFQEKFIGTGIAPETWAEAMKLARHMTAEEGQSDLDDALGLAASWCEVNGIEDEEGAF